MNTTTKLPNRLINEKSPYLLQHAYNPVDWYPWCDEAFAKAAAEDIPVFLSIGYSTCHWCHVMERESFEDNEVAETLRESFVAVKVDREERPDVDSVYMSVTHALTGSGGWPMTLLLTPDKRAFFAGTYFPKSSRGGAPGLLELLREAARQWKTNRLSLESLGDRITSLMHSRGNNPHRTEFSAEDLRRAFQYFSSSFDNENGGFAPPPKFPAPHNLLFLMRYGVLDNNPRAVDMAAITLRQMFRGGIFDHVGGGFSRYSTDPYWLVPHFEKMLYDNALLVNAYCDAFRLSHDHFFRRVAERTLDYIARDMTNPDGGFFSAQDADSNGREGLYYLWRPDEVSDILGAESAKYWCDWFSVTSTGNFEGLSIPNLLHNPDYKTENPRIESLNETLRALRPARVKLHKDDKSLAAWNALMISAFADAYMAFGHSDYLCAAERAAAFIREKLIDSNGVLHVSYRGGAVSGAGYLDDYAFYVRALLSLFDATYKPEYLASALDYANKMLHLFADPDGGFFLYSSNAEQLITRPKEIYDGALPSGNSAAAFVLTRIAMLTGNALWEERASGQLRFVAAASGHPASNSFAIIAAMPALFPQKRLVTVLNSSGDVENLRITLSRHFSPNLCVLALTPHNRESLTNIIPELAAFSTLDGQPAFYFCEGNSCSLAFVGFDELDRRLGGYPVTP